MTDKFLDDSPEDAEHDIRFFDLMNAAGLVVYAPDTNARAIRMAKKLKLKSLEWSKNRERPYFASEFINGLEN